MPRQGPASGLQPFFPQPPAWKYASAHAKSGFEKHEMARIGWFKSESKSAKAN